MSDPRKSESHRRFRTPLLAMLVAALTVGVGLLEAAPSFAGPSLTATAPAKVGGSPHGSGAATHLPPPPWAKWPTDERRAAYASVLAGGPKAAATVLQRGGYSPSLAGPLYRYLVEHPEAVFTPDDTGGLVSGLEAAGLGCGLGAIGGAIVGGPVGAGVGCAVGAVGFLLLQDYLGTSAGGIALVNEDNIVRTEVTAFTNYVNITTAQFTNYLSGWNSTLYAWENAADAAAVSQVGNSSFNYPQDLAMSYVGYQFNAMSYPTFAQVGAAYQQIDRVMYSIYSPSGLTTHDYVVFGDGACVGGGSCSPRWYGGVNVVSSVTAGTNGVVVSILKGATFSSGCLTGQHGNLTDGVTGQAVMTFNNTSGTVGNIIHTNFTGTDGAYILYGSASGSTGCSLTGAGILALPPSPLAGTVSTSESAYWCGTTKTPSTCNPILHPIVAGSQPDTIVGHNTTAMADLEPTDTFLGGVMLAWSHQVSTMLETVESNAFTYWAYLRALGYTSVSQIPSDCIIPFPDLATPAYNANGAVVSINDTEALYGAELNALATFFNVAPGTSSFCHGHAVFTFGSQPGPVLGENVTGFVLTLPVGTHQKWKVPYTWAVNGSNPGITAQENIVGATNHTPIGLTIWPSSKTVKIPLGTVVQVASNNPLYLMVPQTFLQYALYGNGSAQTDGGTLTGTASSSQAGVAIYLTSCVINGQAENPCVFNYTTISDAVGNISCFPNCETGSGLTILTPSSGCGAGVPLLGPLVAGLAGAVSGVPIIGGVACDIAWAVVLVITLVVVIVVIYVVVWVVRGRD